MRLIEKETLAFDLLNELSGNLIPLVYEAVFQQIRVTHTHKLMDGLIKFLQHSLRKRTAG